MTTPDDEEKEIEATKAPLMEHLIELRSRLIKALLAFVVAMIACFFFARHIYNVLTWPYVWVAGAGPLNGCENVSELADAEAVLPQDRRQRVALPLGLLQHVRELRFVDQQPLVAHAGVGLDLLIADLVQQIFSSDLRSINTLYAGNGLDIGSAHIPFDRLLAAAIAILLTAAQHTHRTAARSLCAATAL